MKIQDLILIGGACLAGYFLWKQIAGEGFDLGGFGGGGGGGFLGGGGEVPSTLPPGVPPPLGSTRANTPSTTTAGVASTIAAASSWTGVTYGQPGQPSVRFLANTIRAASSPTASQQTKIAASAAYAGAPPRVVAKIKAGKFY